MYTGLLVGICCVVLFWRAADYERITPLPWVVASGGLTAIIFLRGGGLAPVLAAQALLFIVLWWYNIRRKGRQAD